VFVGRSRELASLLGAADAADGARASLLLIGGEAGVGKSRLLEEFLRVRRAAGSIVLEGPTIAVGAEGLPFEPIVAALRSATTQLGIERVAELAGPSLSDVARLVPELATGTDRVPVPLSQAEWLHVRTFEGILGLLGRLGAAAPALLVIEDIHWADRSTRDVLAFLARNVREERLLIVATFRTDELHRRHPLVGWLAEVERLARVERLDLPRFDRAEIAELLHGILGTPPAADQVDSIAARSDGNAFFAEELASRLDDSGAGRLPSTVTEIVLARLSTLSEPAARLVEVAAVAGREVDHDLLSAVAGLPEAEMLGALREAVSSHLLVTAGTSREERYRFRHALVQEAVYDDILPSDRRQLHAAYAAAIAGDDGAGTSETSRLVELAHHWSAANRPALALRAAIDAADASRASFAFAEAAGLYERAIELWDVVPETERPDHRDLGELFDAASAMVVLGGDPTRAVALAERAIEQVDRLTGPDALARRATARERLGRAAWVAGDGARSISALEEAVRLLEGTKPSIDQARVLAGLAANLMLAGRVHESAPIAERSIDLARKLVSPEIEGHAKATLGVDRASLGAVRDGVELLRSAIDIATAIHDPTTIGRAYANLGTVQQMGGDLEGALATYLAGIEASRAFGNERTYGTYLAINAAGELVLLGRPAEAAGLLEQVEGRGILPGISSVHFHTTRAELWVRTGDLSRARADLAVARAEAESIEDVQFAGDIEGISAEVELEAGEPEKALEIIRRGFERVAGSSDPRVTGPLTMLGVRAAADAAVRFRATRGRGQAASGDVARELTGAYLASVATLDDADELARAEMNLVRAILQAELARAEGRDDPAAWAAIRPALAARRTPYLEAYVLWREAEAADRDSPAAAADAVRAGLAIARAAGARLLADRIESLARRRRISVELAPAAAEPEPATSRAPADPFGLTNREREILRLLAEGYSNRRIAESLFITESTAGVHVSNILGKLGVTSRTEAATTAVRLGLDRVADVGARPDPAVAEGPA
jgi:DNA-binding CsgD family transcriptional regulator